MLFWRKAFIYVGWVTPTIKGSLHKIIPSAKRPNQPKTEKQCV